MTDKQVNKEPVGAKPLDFHAAINMAEPIINLDDLTKQEAWAKKKLIEAFENLPKQKISGSSPRCGKTISQYYCPDCKTKLVRVDETTLYCLNCKKKVKAMMRD